MDGKRLTREEIELYHRVVDSYRELLRANPDYTFKKHCAQWSIPYPRIIAWLPRHNIFISEIQADARAEMLESAFQGTTTRPRVGTFVSISPENEVMGGWRNTIIPRVDIYIPGRKRITVRKTTVANVIALAATYAEQKVE